MPAPPPFQPEFDPFGNPYGEDIKKINEEIDASTRMNARAQLDEFGFPRPLGPTTFYDGYPSVDTTVLRNDQPIMMVKSDIDMPVATAKSVSEDAVLEQSNSVETTSSEMTKSQKWAWVIGLTFAAWALIYWTNKKAE